jgi:hypothetical protein
MLAQGFTFLPLSVASLCYVNVTYAGSFLPVVFKELAGASSILLSPVMTSRYTRAIFNATPACNASYLLTSPQCGFPKRDDPQACRQGWSPLFRIRYTRN